MQAAKNVAVRLTRSDSSTIATSLGSKCVTRDAATARLSEKVFKQEKSSAGMAL